MYNRQPCLYSQISAYHHVASDSLSYYGHYRDHEIAGIDADEAL